MSDLVTITLHADKTTEVRSARYESNGAFFTSFEIGSVSIFATVELLRRIADEATKAAMVAEGWAPPAPPPGPPVDLAPNTVVDLTNLQRAERSEPF